ncbi:MAG: hypothetical protein QM791_04280 [Ferruginibacter sp.]
MKKKEIKTVHIPPPDEITLLIRPHKKIYPIPYRYDIDRKQFEKVKKILNA